MEESIKQCSPPQCHLKGDFYHENEGKKDENWPLSEVRGHMREFQGLADGFSLN